MPTAAGWQENIQSLASQETATTATLSNVAGSTSSTTLLAANAARKRVFVYNDSSSAMYLACATTASTSSYSIKIPANTLYEMSANPIYPGALAAVWDTATGTARVTEVV